MRKTLVLTARNLKEILRDPLSLGIAVALPVLLLLTLQALGGDSALFLTPTYLTPGIVLFGMVMVMFASAMILARDRETALLARLLTTPLRSIEFVAGYSVPYVLVALAQAAVLLLIGAALGLDAVGSIVLVVVVMLLMAIFYVALGMVFGSVLTVAQVSGAYALVLLLTIFGGAWFDLEEIGGVFLAVGNALPFKHALDASRAVLADGAGLGDIGTDLMWIGGYAVGASVLAVGAFQRRMLE
ncbi:MAG: ABC transporter permease [Acidimicrobiales bacterium]